MVGHRFGHEHERAGGHVDGRDLARRGRYHHRLRQDRLDREDPVLDQRALMSSLSRRSNRRIWRVRVSGKGEI